MKLDETTGRAVRSSSKDLTLSGQSRYIGNGGPTSLSPIREKNEIPQLEGREGVLGVMGYAAPVVPIV